MTYDITELILFVYLLIDSSTFFDKMIDEVLPIPSTSSAPYPTPSATRQQTPSRSQLTTDLPTVSSIFLDSLRTGSSENNNQYEEYRRQFFEKNQDFDVSKERLSELLQLHGYSANREALIILEDHYTSYNQYDDLEDFILKLHYVITNKTDNDESVITPDLAYKATCILSEIKFKKRVNEGLPTQLLSEIIEEPIIVEPEIPDHLSIRIKNVAYEDIDDVPNQLDFTKKHSNRFNEADFAIHYNYLFKKLNSLPVFSGDFKIIRLSTLMYSDQPSIRCICFGLLVKDTSKLDGYMLIDSSNHIPLKITPETTFRNKLAYTNCIVVVEGVYISDEHMIFAANIGLPPILLDQIPTKQLACKTEKLIVILKEIYLDDLDVCKAINQLFIGYNSMDDPPLAFIMIGNFTRENCEPIQLHRCMKKLAKMIISCDNLRQSHIIMVPGSHDTIPHHLNETISRVATRVMPKPPIRKKVSCMKLFKEAGFLNVHMATNPTHIYVGDRLISVVSHSYVKEIRKNLIHDLSDHREEFFNTIQRIILSNGHLTAGISKRFDNSMNLWHRPDLLVLADTEAFGNRYDWSSSKLNDTTFTTLPSFTRQSNQFKVYCINSGEVEDSQISADNVDEDNQIEDDGLMEQSED